MRKLFFVVATAGLIFIVIGVLRGPPVQDATTTAGCRDPLHSFQRLPNQRVLSLSSGECHGADGALLDKAAAIDAVAAAAWSSPTPRFDALSITVNRTEAPTTRKIPRGELVSRFGARDPSLDQTEDSTLSISQLGWILLPLFIVVNAVLPISAGVQSARAGLVLIWIPR